MSMMIHPEIPQQPVVRKLRIRESSRIDFLEQLRRMNIHRASLFPGLDGFCEYLKVDLKIKVERERRLANQARDEAMNV
jgi:hypothetical protein